MEKIVLEIIGFRILINFKLSNKSYSSIHLMRNINKYFKNFITENNLGKYDFIIDIIENNVRLFDFIGENESKKTHTFINFFDRVGTRRITTFHYIGIFQFYRLLVYILENLLVRNNGFILNATALLKNEKINLLLNRKEHGSLNPYIVETINAPSILSQLIIRKQKKGFVLYNYPHIKQWIPINIIKNSYGIGKIYIPKKSNEYRILKILNTENIPSYILKFTNIPRIIRRLEYKYYSYRLMKCFFEFVKQHEFYYLYYGRDVKKNKRLIDIIQ